MVTEKSEGGGNSYLIGLNYTILGSFCVDSSHESEGKF